VPAAPNLTARRALSALTLAVALATATAGSVPAYAQPAPPLDPTLREQVVMVPKPMPIGSIELETTVYRPPGDGPFPVVVINHGKEGGEPALQARARYPIAARELLRRGYAVVLPMRQGFSRSTGYYIQSGCNLVGNGLAQAEDVKVVLDHLSKEPWFDRTAIVVMGQSHGGWTALAFGALGHPGLRGVVNFAGGLRDPSCAAWDHNLIRAAGELGERSRVPGLWFYGDNDSYFSPFVFRGMHEAFVRAGGAARLVAFGTWPHGDAHAMFGGRAGLDTWLPALERFLGELGLPSAPGVRLPTPAHAAPVPAASGFARIDDVAALPVRGASARTAYPRYLSAEAPKAFVLSPEGAWGWYTGRSDAMAAALEACQRNTRTTPCALYAVDDQVVWTSPPER
jgi:dienelactone hydrolase